jgi:hypothetical protein
MRSKRRTPLRRTWLPTAAPATCPASSASRRRWPSRTDWWKHGFSARPPATFDEPNKATFYTQPVPTVTASFYDTGVSKAGPRFSHAHTVSFSAPCATESSARIAQGALSVRERRLRKPSLSKQSRQRAVRTSKATTLSSVSASMSRRGDMASIVRRRSALAVSSTSTLPNSGSSSTPRPAGSCSLSRSATSVRSKASI